MHGANFKDFRYSLWTMWRRECQLSRDFELYRNPIIQCVYCENCAILGSNIGKINNVPHRLLFLMLPSYLLTYRLYLAFGDLYTSELKIWKNRAIIYCMNCVGLSQSKMLFLHPLWPTFKTLNIFWKTPQFAHFWILVYGFKCPTTLRTPLKNSWT